MKKSIKANNKNVKTIVITILIIILIIIAIGSILILNKKNKTPSILNIGENDVKYFILEKNGINHNKKDRIINLSLIVMVFSKFIGSFNDMP